MGFLYPSSCAHLWQIAVLQLQSLRLWLFYYPWVWYQTCGVHLSPLLSTCGVTLSPTFYIYYRIHSRQHPSKVDHVLSFHRWGHRGSETLSNWYLATELDLSNGLPNSKRKYCFPYASLPHLFFPFFFFFYSLRNRNYIYTMFRLLKISGAFKWKFLIEPFLSHVRTHCIYFLVSFHQVRTGGNGSAGGNMFAKANTIERAIER